MALISRLRSSAQLLRQPDKFLKGRGRENVVIYPYDDAFFQRYGVFVDNIHRIEGDILSGDPDSDSLLSVLTPTALVDIMLSEHNCDMTLTGNIEELLYMRFDESIASEAIEETFKFYCHTVEPNGFWDILELIRSSRGRIQMIDFVGVREEESLVYVLRNSE